jgi:hypothetical protein
LLRAATAAIAAIAAFLVGMALAAPAHADGDSDYLSMLSKYGFNVTGDDSSTLIKTGHLICTDLRNGTSAADESAALYRILPKATDKQSGNLVTVAQTIPGQLGRQLV